MKKLLTLILCCLVATASLAKTPGEVEVGGVLREAQLNPLGGSPRQLSEFRGKPLIINVWASWCAPCRAEMGSLENLARRYGGRQFNIIGISTDDYRDRALLFLKQSNTTFPNFIDSKPFPLENMLGADRLPLTVLVDAQGKVLGKYYGARAWDSPESLELIQKTLGLKL